MESTQYKKSGRCWLLLIGCCIMCGIGFGVPMTTMSTFMGPMIKALGASATEVTLYFTFVTFASIPAVIVGPRLLAKNAGAVVATCGVVVGLAFCVLALLPSVPMIWGAAVIVGLFYPLASTLSTPILVANWFHKSSGLFMGIAMAFTGVGSAVLVPIMAGVIANAGWQNALLGLGVAYAIVIAVTGVLIIRFDPLKMGILPYGATEADVQKASSGANAAMGNGLPGVCYKDIFKMPAFYILSVCLLVCGFVSIINQQINTISQLSGFAIGTAALAVSFMSLGNVVGKLMLGAIKDKTTGAVSGLVGAVFMIAGMCLFLLAISGMNEMYLLAGGVVCGLGSCLGTMACPLYALDTFGPREYGTILGTVSVFVTLGNAFGSPIVSSFYDASGSYEGALIILIVCTAIMVPLGFAAVKLGQAKWKKKEETTNASSAEVNAG